MGVCEGISGIIPTLFDIFYEIFGVLELLLYIYLVVN